MLLKEIVVGIFCAPKSVCSSKKKKKKIIGFLKQFLSAYPPCFLTGVSF